MLMSEEFIMLRDKATQLKDVIQQQGSEQKITEVECAKLGRLISEKKQELEACESDIQNYELLFYFKNGSKAIINTSSDYELLKNRYVSISLSKESAEKQLSEQRQIAREFAKRKTELSIDMRFCFSIAHILSTMPINSPIYEGTRYGVLIKNYREDGTCTEKNIYLYLKDDIWSERNDEKNTYEPVKKGSHYDYLIRTYLSNK